MITYNLLIDLDLETSSFLEVYGREHGGEPRFI